MLVTAGYSSVEITHFKEVVMVNCNIKFSVNLSISSVSWSMVGWRVPSTVMILQASGVVDLWYFDKIV